MKYTFHQRIKIEQRVLQIAQKKYKEKTKLAEEKEAEDLLEELKNVS